MAKPLINCSPGTKIYFVSHCLLLVLPNAKKFRLEAFQGLFSSRLWSRPWKAVPVIDVSHFLPFFFFSFYLFISRSLHVFPSVCCRPLSPSEGVHQMLLRPWLSRFDWVSLPLLAGSLPVQELIGSGDAIVFLCCSPSRHKAVSVVF